MEPPGNVVASFVMQGLAANPWLQNGDAYFKVPVSFRGGDDPDDKCYDFVHEFCYDMSHTGNPLVMAQNILRDIHILLRSHAGRKFAIKMERRNTYYHVMIRMPHPDRKVE